MEMGISCYCWLDDVLTSTYLLNSLTSSHLHGEVPMYHLHPRFDIFILPLCVFGCVVFLQDHSPNISSHCPNISMISIACDQQAIQPPSSSLAAIERACHHQAVLAPIEQSYSSRATFPPANNKKHLNVLHEVKK